MLKLFFHRDSPIVSVFEVLGVALLGWFLWRGGWWNWSAFSVVALGSMLALSLFLRVCTTKHWYPRSASLHPANKYPGIETHFKRAYVPVPYIMTIVGTWCHAGYSPWILYLVVFLLLIIAHGHAILLYLHFKDRDPAPVNCFSYPAERPKEIDTISAVNF